MIKHWLITGDTHGKVCERIANIDQEKYPPNETALIILGDAGINYYLNNTDKRNKKNIQNAGYLIYCVRGNHEQRPEKVPGIHPMYDENVEGTVLHDIEYPNIRYLMDGNTYLINGKSILIIGGAYSVDKWYRLARFPAAAGWTGWFADEQLSAEEMRDISDRFNGKHFDFIFSHTCSESWEPRDLFLPGLDQSTVDKSMEKWLDQFKDTVSWNVWLFGHFHDDRLVRPGVEMYYTDIEDLETIWERWQHPDQLDWWLKKDPNYYSGT